MLSLPPILLLAPLLALSLLSAPSTSLAFDPRVSPHAYAKPPSSPSTRLVLLDHGSPHPKSSPRLQEVAEIMTSRGVVPTTHAHMEITEPSLSSAVLTLRSDPTVTRILVHPLFISPFGKHVTKDVPALVAGCVAEAEADGWTGEIMLTDCFGEDPVTLVKGVEEVIKPLLVEEPGNPFAGIMEAMKAMEAMDAS